MLQAAPAAAAPTPSHDYSNTAHATPAPPGRATDPAKNLGAGWKTCTDRAVTGAADTDGFEILTADSGQAYAWKTAAVLAEPGLSADSWMGNQCVIDHDHVAAVHAPRSFTNKPDLNAIHPKAPNAKVVLMGYPRLVERDHSCLPGAYETVENYWVRNLADTLATEMKGATQDAGPWAVFSDPRDEFDGKGVCGNPENIHGIVVTGREQADNDAPAPSMQSFHRKPAGARLYADALEQTLQGE